MYNRDLQKHPTRNLFDELRSISRKAIGSLVLIVLFTWGVVSLYSIFTLVHERQNTFFAIVESHQEALVSGNHRPFAEGIARIPNHPFEVRKICWGRGVTERCESFSSDLYSGIERIFSSETETNLGEQSQHVRVVARASFLPSIILSFFVLLALSLAGSLAVLIMRRHTDRLNRLTKSLATVVLDVVKNGPGSATDLPEEIRPMAEALENYKRTFEKKTQMDQLAQTIGYSSHNLLAPYLEGIDFLRDLPERLESVPRDRLIRSAKSLERRLQQGADTLKSALQSTKETYSTLEQVGLNSFLRDFQKQVETSYKVSGARVELSTGQCGDQVQIACNPPELAAAFWNIFKNAQDVKSDARVRLLTSIDRDEVVVRIQDDGPGIPEPLLERIFEDFYTTKSRGTGLGLASVRTTLNRFNGSVRALPSPSGALLEIRLPLTAQSPGGLGHV